MKKLLSIFIMLFAVVLCLSSCDMSSLGNVLGGLGGGIGGNTTCDHADMSEWKTVKAATCTEDGTRTKSCLTKGCDYVVTETIEKGHNLKKYEAIEATCTEEGLSSYERCTRCGYHTVCTVIPKVDHDYGTPNVIIAPTCVDKGKQTKTCKDCGFVKAEDIAISGHTAGAEATCTSEQVCTVCNAVLAEKKGHTAGAEATCTSAQLCTVCNAELAPKKEHTPGAEATCTAAQLCTVCNTELAPKKEHTPGNAVIENAVAASCTADGSYDNVIYCIVCNVQISRENVVVPAIDHTAGAAATCTTAQLCTVCNTVITAALGHDMDDGEITLAPTCTSTGIKTTTCKRGCGHTETEDIPVTHDIIIVAGKDATCYESGYTASEHCNLCDYSVESVTIPAGHKGEWIAINDNYESIVCTVCGRKQIREKNAVIDFEGDTIPFNKNAFSVTVGALKGEGAASIDAAAGLTEFGNARDKFTLASDASNKVLRIISKNNANYNKSSIKFFTTDLLHNANANEDGGKYLVLDFDMRFDKFDGTNTGKSIFTLYGYEGLGNNFLCNFTFYNYNGNLRVGNSGYVKNADGEYADIWFSFRAVTVLATEKDANGKYVANTNIYYKVKDADDSAYTLLASSSRSHTDPYAFTGRTSSHYYQITVGDNDYDYSYDFDNISFIRTSDASYSYCTCNHEIEETVTLAPTYAEDGIVERRCTKDGCGYVETEYIPATYTTEDYDLIEYGPEYIQTSGNMETTSKLVAGRADILADKHLIFTAKVVSFEGIRIGHGYKNYNAAYMEIDDTYVKCYRYLKESTTIYEQAHGLTIAGDIKVTIDVDNRLNANIVIYSGDQSFSFKVERSWGGSNGEIYAESLGSKFGGAQVAFTTDGYGRDIHFYGDSYLSQSSDRWLYYAFAEGHTNALFDGYGGRTSDGALASLIENLKHSTPKTVVWMLGMNDGSDTNINIPSKTWSTNRDKLIALAEEYGFELIFTTIPTVPNINHEGKNKWIKESGYRYIDMAAGLGADGTGKWIDGYLHTDEVHPTRLGAEAIYKQVAKDFPEFVGLCYHSVSEWTTIDPTCTEAGAKSGVCSKCGETVSQAIPALGHDMGEWIDIGNQTQQSVCSVCGHTESMLIIPPTHVWDAWVSFDANYEQRVCSDCGLMQKREKSDVIDFEGSSILSNNKLTVTVGALTGEGDASVNAEAGLTEFGNARDKFTLSEDTSSKALKVVLKNNTNYAASEIRVDLTDKLHNTNVSETGGQYLVFDFDMKFEEFAGTNSSKEIFTLKGFEGLGKNWLCNFPFYNYNGKLRVGTSDKGYVTNADGAYADTWFTFRAVTTLINGTSGNGMTTIYYKERDAADSTFKAIMSSSHPSATTYATVTRTSIHYYRFLIATNDYDYTYYLDNISFIRTSDASYLYNTCAHEMSDWTVKNGMIPCTTDGAVTRHCTVEDCGYTETEYVSAHKLTTVDAVIATCGKAGVSAHQICSECGTIIGKVDTPAFDHNLTEWTSLGDNKQERSCKNAGCDYYEKCDVSVYNPITFDDGTVSSGDKIYYSNNVSVNDNGSAATAPNGYISFAVLDNVPGRVGETAIRASSDTSKYGAGATPYMYVPANYILSNAEGNVYTFDFDTYLQKGSDNSTRYRIAISFGGVAIDSINTYGTNVRTTKCGSFNLATAETWISFRVVISVVEDGTASYKLYMKNSSGAYAEKLSTTIKGDGIKKSVDNIELSYYFGGVGAEDGYVYLDNLSLTCVTDNCNHVVDGWTTSLQPACTTDGERVGVCSKCHFNVVEAIDSLGHDMGSWVDMGDELKRYCARCDYDETREKADAENPIASVTVNNGEIKLIFEDNSELGLGTLSAREGYNGAAVAYDFDAASGIVTLSLLDSSSFNVANNILNVPVNELTVRIRESYGMIEWASEDAEDWKLLCTADGSDGAALELLAKATAFGKHETITSDRVVLVINGASLRFRAREWKDNLDFVSDAKFSYVNNNFNFTSFIELNSNTALDSMAGGTRFKQGDDDITPIGINGTYIGANHGYYIIAVVDNTTGLTEADIGSIWQGGANRYVLVKVSATKAWFCPYYEAAMESGKFDYKKIASGTTMTHERGATHTNSFTTTADSTQQQFYVSINHSIQRVFLNGTQEVNLASNGCYTAEFVDFYEEYDVIYLPAMLQYLIENVGNNTNDSQHDDAIAESYVTFRNTYRFHKNGAYVVYSSYEFHKDVDVIYIGGVQSIRFDESTHYVYVPGTTTLSTPTLQGDGEQIFVTQDKLADPDKLPTSYFQFSDANGTKGMNLGYNPLYGTAVNDVRKEYIGTDYGYYYTSYKLYPRLIANCKLTAGTNITCVAYHVPSYILDDDFTAINWYWVGDDIYLSLHTDASVDKTVTILPEYMNGMEISIVEISDSFTVNSDTIENGSISVTSSGAGYTIVKLSNPAN